VSESLRGLRYLLFNSRSPDPALPTWFTPIRVDWRSFAVRSLLPPFPLFTPVNSVFPPSLALLPSVKVSISVPSVISCSIPLPHDPALPTWLPLFAPVKLSPLRSLCFLLLRFRYPWPPLSPVPFRFPKVLPLPFFHIRVIRAIRG
jgi:hypothetical protein